MLVRFFHKRKIKYNLVFEKVMKFISTCMSGMLSLFLTQQNCGIDSSEGVEP